MHKLKASLILLSISLLIFACATTKQKQKMPPFKFGGTTLSKEINKSDDLGIPVEPTNTFNTEDDKVIALIRFENLAGQHHLRWEWYDPSGNLYFSTDNFPFKTSRDKYFPLATAWHRLSINGDPAANNPGQWEVKVFLDDELMDTKPFIVKVFKDAIQLPTDFAQKPYPKDWGLIIGIEDYAHLPNVDYARKDALILKEYFIKVLGVPEENIISLIDSDATKARLEGYLKEYIPSNVGQDSTLYVYFAGHGAPGKKKGEPFIIPYDGDTRFIEQTGYKLVNFYKDLNNLKVQKVYVFLDSCFSGVAARAAEMLVKGARPALVHVKDVSPPSGSIVSFAAASSGQISNAYPEKEHGLFTYFLLRALNGEADSDDDGWTSVKEMYGYVKSNVTRVARRMSAEQTPVLMPTPKKLKDVSVSKVPH
jgi:uncharacterized caspase-like protein